MLAEIRRRLAASAPHDAVRSESSKSSSILGSRVEANVDGSGRPVIERFCESLQAVAGHCFVAEDELAVKDVIREIIQKHSASRVAISDSKLVRRAVEETAGVEIFSDPSRDMLFDCDVGITGAQWAIAETGTLVLESEKENHRLTSLVPPIHIAVIEKSNVCATLIEVLQEIGAKGQESLSRTVTFITGPSRTSDIELTLAIGVHGPAELYVIVLERKLGD